jgi:hypothetical protein
MHRTARPTTVAGSAKIGNDGRAEVREALDEETHGRFADTLRHQQRCQILTSPYH